MWLVCIDILKIVNWKCTVSVIIHNNSPLSSGSRYCKPEVISWWKVNITVFYACFLSRLIRNVRSSWRFDSSSIIAHPTAGEIIKMWCQEFDIYLLANICTYIYRYRYHPLDKRYGFSLSVQPEITSLLMVFTRGQFWPSGIVVACVCLSVCVSVCVCVR